MDKNSATSVFESLASGVRLDIFRLLVKNAPDGLVAGEIANQLNLPPTNLSFHLKASTYAGLLTVTQEGRYQRYRANLDLIQDLILYLTEHCCTASQQSCFEHPALTNCCDSDEPISNPTDICP